MQSGNQSHAAAEREDDNFVKCESCGGNLVFDPESQALVCEHCGNKIDFAKDSAVREEEIEKAFLASDVWGDATVLKCDNCGAEITVSGDSVSVVCPYCGTSHVKKTDELAGIKPGAVYPFSVTMKEAAELAKKWAKSKLFAPRKFKKNLAEKNLRGVYQPCFTFDSRTLTAYNGRVGYHRTRTVHTSKGVRTETYTEWEHISGNIRLDFDDVMISASKSVPQSKIDKLSPFDGSTLSVYEKRFLAGFTARHYDKDVRDAWSEAKSVMDYRIRSAIERRYGCDEVDYINASTRHSDVTYKYVLLPVYLMFYEYKQKKYEVGVNGSTGKVVGKSPISFWRVLVAIALAAAVVVGAAFIIKNLLLG